MAKKIGLYASMDLKGWAPLSEFGSAGANYLGCPDLFSLEVEGEPAAKKWVLIVNINPCNRPGDSGLKEFHPAFAGSRHAAPLRITDGHLTIRFLLDTSSLEVFAQDGENRSHRPHLPECRQALDCFLQKVGTRWRCPRSSE